MADPGPSRRPSWVARLEGRERRRREVTSSDPQRRIDDADFSGVRLHGPDFGEARITDGWFKNTDLSGDIEGLVVNGIEVEPLVRAELDRRNPERVTLRSEDPSDLRDGWSIIEAIWSRTVERALQLPERLLHERVDGDWSFVETLRHLVLATDIWLYRMIRHESRPYHPWGLAGSFLTDPAGIGLDQSADPSLVEILEVRQGRMGDVKATIDTSDRSELGRVCVPPEPAGHPREPHTVLQCLHVILNEEWEHNQYANRDLRVLELNAN
jgi:DinB superfamily